MKTASKIAAFVAIVLALGFVVSCGGKGSKSLAGTKWQYTNTDEDSGTVTGEYINFTSETEFTIGMILNDDSSDMYSGTYKNDGKTITLTVGEDSTECPFDGEKISYDNATFIKK